MLSQDCATPDGSLYPYPYEDPLEDPTGLGEPILINIYLHVVREDNGSGGLTSNEINLVKTSLSAEFEPHAIYFNYCDDVLDCSDCRNDWDDLTSYFPSQSYDDGINVYVLPTGTSVTPQAESVPSKNAAVEYLGASTGYAHEVGHCLGLLHTFFDSECPTGLPEEHAWYYVNGVLTYGVDCNKLGDEICDTPPDLRRCVDPNDCNFFENPNDLEDAFGHVYIDPENVVNKNLMAYSNCRTDFTEDQEIKMREMLDLAEELEGVAPFSYIDHISESTTWNKPLNFNHDLLIEEGAHLTIEETTVSFTPGYGIVMEAGSLLTLDGATLTVGETSCPSSTGVLWKGIGLHRQESGEYSTLTITNESRIEHADRAIYGIGKGRQWTLVYDSDFVNNRVSFESHNLTAGATLFQTTDFIVDDDYKLNSYYAQLSLIHCTPVFMRACTLDFQIEELYSYTRHGIQTYNSHVVVTKWGLNRSVFNNWTEAIFAISNLGSKLTYVRDADFNGNFKGVNSLNFWRTTCTKNVFDLSNEVIGSGAHGIFSEKSRAILFNDNNFASTDPDIMSTGIEVGSTFSEKLALVENTFTDLDIGIRGVLVGTSGNGMMFLCNENDGNRDFDFDIEGGVGPTQGRLIKPTGNTFSHASGTSESDFRLTNVPYSVVYYYKQGLTSQTPQDYSSNFNPIPTSSNSGCGLTVFALDPTVAESLEEYEYVKSSLDGSIADLIEDKDDLIDDGDTPGVISMIQSTSGSDPAYVAGRLSGLGPWLSLDAGASFLDFIANFSEAQIVSVIASSPFVLRDVEIYDFVFGGSSPLSSNAQNTIKAAVLAGDARSELEADIGYYSTQWNVNTNSAVTYVLLQDSLDYELLREVLGWREDLQSEFSIAETFMDQREFEDALDYLDGTSGRLSMSNDEEDDLEDFITMTSMLVNVYEDDRYETELTEQEIDTLEEIAENGVGMGKDKACSLLAFFYDYDCEEEEELIHFQHPPIATSGAIPGKVRVSPNPANDEILVDLSSVALTEGVLELYNYDGRMVRREIIPELTFQLKLNLAVLPEGMYIIRIMDSGQEIFADKVLKQAN